MSDANTSALARRLAQAHNLDLSALSGSGANGAVTARDVLEHLNQESKPGVADNSSESSVQKAEAEINPVIQTPAEHAARVTQGTMPEVEEAETSQNSAHADSEAPPTPRWMFWRR